jgi:hypothetical protein
MATKQKETFIQIWDYILDNDELDVSDVLLLSKVISLHTSTDGCYMTNEYITKMLRLKNVETASRRINKLQKMGYVNLKYIPLPTNEKKTRRYIIPTYKNGLMLKSSRVDLKVNTPLTTKSTPIDLKVNTPLTSKSIPHCLESQSIISVDNIIDNINKKHQVYNTNLEYQENPVNKLNQFEVTELIKIIKSKRIPESVEDYFISFIKNEDITRKNKSQILKYENTYQNTGTKITEIFNYLKQS